MIDEDQLEDLRNQMRSILAEDMGLAKVKFDTVRDLVFTFETLTFFCVFSKEDPSFVRIMCPNFWPIETDDERLKFSKAGLEAGSKCKCVKISSFTDEFGSTNVSSGVEFLIHAPGDIDEGMVSRYLDMIKNGMAEFARFMRKE